MRRLSPAAIGVTLLLAVTLSGCGEEKQPAPQTVTLGGTEASANTELVSRPWGMAPRPPAMQKAQRPSDADVAFISAMIPHHEQALRMSALLLEHEPLDDRVRAAAEFIAADQGLEIRTMQSWLDAWRAEIDPPSAHHDHGAMPGMLEPAEVEALADLGSGRAQLEFLALMVRHHEGAVTMSQEYLDDAVNVFTLATAQHVIREQQVEIRYLNQVLDSLR
ncbi:DUF305 domain-containing protein [Nocardioides sp. Bht2]|uniref:DUF305 domain-containing protein n=1 Tax=Nocardioides sp. Bht2 TaxID=3392297 RepID=UPI0039B5792E